MSFIQKNEITGKPYEAGYFLADAENCIRLTKQAYAANGTSANGGKYIPMGTAYPSNDGNAIGIVYEDVDVTTGDMPCSVVVKGTVIESKLPVALETAAKNALLAKGFTFI